MILRRYKRCKETIVIVASRHKIEEDRPNDLAHQIQRLHQDVKEVPT